MAATAKKKQDPELDDAKKRAMRNRAQLKSSKTTQEEDVIDKRKSVTY